MLIPYLTLLLFFYFISNPFLLAGGHGAQIETFSVVSFGTCAGTGAEAGRGGLVGWGIEAVFFFFFFFFFWGFGG